MSRSLVLSTITVALALIAFLVARVEFRPREREALPIPPPATEHEGVSVRPTSAVLVSRTRTEQSSAAPIRGRVISVNGTPVSDAEILIFGRGAASRGNRYRRLADSADHGRAWTVARSESEGDFVIALPRSRDAQMLITHAEYLPWNGDRPVPGRALEIRLFPAQGITGRVVDGTGNGYPGVTIHPEPAFVATAPIWERASHLDRSVGKGLLLADGFLVTTGEDGRFALGGLLPLDYALNLYSPCGHPAGVVDGVPGGTRDIQICLPVRRELRGQVIDEEGQPIRAARIELVSKLPEEQEGRIQRRLEQTICGESASAATLDDGRFAFRGVLPGEFLLRVEADGFCSTKEKLEVQPDETATDVGQIGLVKAARLSGRVVSEDRSEVSGAEIWLLEPRDAIEIVEKPRRHRPQGAKHFTTTDASGRFILASMPPGPYFLEVAKTGFAPSGLREVTVPHEEVTVALSVGVPVFGHVVESESKQPVAGARVTIDGGPPTTTDERGVFVVHGVVPAEFEGERLYISFLATHPDYAPGRDPMAIEFESGAPGMVIAHLQPWKYVFGEIVDEAGRPVAGARLEVLGASGRRLGDSGLNGTVNSYTSDNGEFTVAWAGRRRSLRVTHPGYADLLEPSMRVLSRGEAVTLVLDRGARIFGRVVDDKEAEMSSVVVSLASAKASSDSRLMGDDVIATHMRSKQPKPKTTLSDANGGFEFDHLNAGPYYVVARRSGWGTARYAVTVEPGEERELQVELNEGISIVGTVSEERTPIIGAEVVASLGLQSDGGDETSIARVFTANDGSYELRNLPRRPLHIIARAPGYAHKTFKGVIPRAGGIRFPIAMETLPAVEIRVVDAEDGRALDDYEARLELLVTDQQRDNRDCLRGKMPVLLPAASHSRQADGLCPGAEYAVLVEHAESAPVTVRFRVTAGELKVLEIALDRGLAIRNFVYDAETGAPVEGAAITLRAAGVTRAIHGAQQVASAADGLGELCHLPEGAYRIEVSHDRYRSERKSDVVLRGDGIELTWRLGRGAVLSGRVNNGTGKEYGPGVVVNFTPIEGEGPLRAGRRRQYTARVESDGSFRVDSLAPGLYDVVLTCVLRAPNAERFFSPEGIVDLGHVVVELEENAPVEFTLP